MKKLYLQNKKLFYYALPTANELALVLKKPVSDLIKFFFTKKILITFNQVLTEDQLLEICLEYGLELEKQEQEKTSEEAISLKNYLFVNKSISKEKKPPIITIMGHVDHGKTSLLDAIKNTRIVDKEFGGITQHIGAYQVNYKSNLITFIDTPGHEAFTHMRARGAKITDIVVLVVAADDGVKPQTKEAIDHAKLANVPIIVAVNKIDKPEADYEKVLDQLSKLDIVAEEWGGKHTFVKISAKQKLGLEDLLENILLQAEMLELKCDVKRNGYGNVLEAKIDKNKGVAINLIVQDGTIKIGQHAVCGIYYGKVRQITNDLGQDVKQALPSMPVQILGFSEVPNSGDTLVVFDSEKEAKEIANKLSVQSTDKKHLAAKTTLMDFHSRVSTQNLKSLNVILRTDVQGTNEAIINALKKIKFEDLDIKVIRYQTGSISLSDVELAMTTNAIIVGFNIRPSQEVVEYAKNNNVQIYLYTVIYKLVEELENLLKGLLKPTFVEEVSGQAEIRQIFKVDKLNIAGCYVLNGEIFKKYKLRLIRNSVVIYDGVFKSLKHLKNDVMSVKKGFECGIMIEGFNDVKEKDIIETYFMKEIKPS